MSSSLSDKEIEILLVLLKDIYTDYNSNSISKIIDITSAGAFKAMKKLAYKGLIIGKKMGKAVFYKINLTDYYTFRTMETLLINEAREGASRWLNEFEKIYQNAELVIIYGSILNKPKSANDIDLLIIPKKDEIKIIEKIIKEKRTISVKPIHTIKMNLNEFKESLKRKDPVLIDIIKSGCILQGYDRLLKEIKNVTSN